MSTLTQESATDGQITQIARVASDAAAKAVRDYANFSKEDAQRIHARGDELAVRVREATILALAELSVSGRFADEAAVRAILGEDILFPDEVRGCSYSEEQLRQLAATLPSNEVLRWLKKNNYALMPAPPQPMSLLEVRELAPKLFYSKSGGWYADQNFAKNDQTAFGWLPIRKDIVPKSTRKNWDDQCRLLAEEERIPNAAEFAWFITTYYRAHGVMLFGNIYARTSSVDSGGDRVYLGYFDSGGLDVNGYWGGNRGDCLGLASARKL